MSPLAQLLAAAGAVALAAFAFRRFGRTSALFVITVQAQEVRIVGEVPGKSEEDVRDFVTRMDLPRGARLWAFRDGSGVRLKFSDDVPDNLRQRSRNFFNN